MWFFMLTPDESVFFMDTETMYSLLADGFVNHERLQTLMWDPKVIGQAVSINLVGALV